jgi:glucosyl-3-phosphoglycerate synthase
VRADPPNGAAPAAGSTADRHATITGRGLPPGDLADSNGPVRGPLIRTYRHGDFDAAHLAELRGADTISVCLPARDEEPTVGAIVTAIREALVERVPLVDEVLVVDDGSTDRTAQVAADAGARVVCAADVLAQHATGHGKGAALWKSVFASTGDLVVWCDADIADFDPGFVTGLVGPMLTRADIDFVKGFYDRPVDGGSQSGGGRVTELVARPIVALLHPQLAAIVQPLAGEYAARRSLLERLPFSPGYGVDLGLLIDVAHQRGIDCIAQVDLGSRRHRNRGLDQLGPQALAVLQAALARAGIAEASRPATLVRPGLDPVESDPALLPPLVEVPAYRRRSA